MSVEDHAGDGDDEAKSGVVQRHRDAVREHGGVGAGRRLRTEDLDHADHRAEQPEQGRDGSDGAKAGLVA